MNKYLHLAQLAIPTAIAAADQASALTTTALLFYEGAHTGMNGKAIAYSADDIQKIADATNKWLERRRIKLYASESDHDISQKAAIGYIGTKSVLTVEEIGPDNAPGPGMELLYGLLGIFGVVTIAGSENVTQYRDGRLEELSVGISTKGEIVEISAVAIPVLAGARLFALDLASTIHGDMSDELYQKSHDLLYQLIRTLESIRRATPELLAGQDPATLMANAVSDFCDRIKAHFGAMPPPDGALGPVGIGLSFSAPTPPLEVTPMPEEITTPDPITTQALPDPVAEKMSARIQHLEAEQATAKQQLALFRRHGVATSVFTGLQQRAIALRDAGKLSPASYAAKFGTDVVPTLADDSSVEESVAAIEKFEAFCASVAAALDEVDQFAPAVKFGMLPTAPLETDSEREALKKEVEATFSAYSIPRAY